MTNIPELALSVRQPWAWAIIHAGKDIENRSWQAVNHGLNQRGRICIHASKGMTRVEYESAREFILANGVDCPHPSQLQFGTIIGSVRVVDVVTDSESPWFMGPRGLVLADPIAAVGGQLVNGQLGYFRWKAENAPAPKPKPWMMSWPERPKAKPDSATANLFQDTPQ